MEREFMTLFKALFHFFISSAFNALVLTSYNMKGTFYHWLPVACLLCATISNVDAAYKIVKLPVELYGTFCRLCVCFNVRGFITYMYV